MTTPAADAARPGITVGSTRGQEADIREAIAALQNSPGYSPPASTDRGTPPWWTSRRAAPAVRLDLPARRGLQLSASGHFRDYGGTVKEIRKAQRVNDAFQRVLDDPAAERRSGARRSRPRSRKR
jgi:hypothetical protein